MYLSDKPFGDILNMIIVKRLNPVWGNFLKLGHFLIDSIHTYIEIQHFYADFNKKGTKFVYIKNYALLSLAKEIAIYAFLCV